MDFPGGLPQHSYLILLNRIFISSFSLFRYIKKTTNNTALIIDCVDAVTTFDRTANVEFNIDIHKAASKNPIFSLVNLLI